MPPVLLQRSGPTVALKQGDNEITAAEATCVGSEQAWGGGGKLIGLSGAAALTASYPTGGKTWRAEAIAISAVTAGEITAYVQCG
jgi:hypothetical protein